MIEFELISEWGGWEHIAIPDDMEVVLKTTDTEHRMEISLASVLELYGYVTNRQSCDLVIGIGSFIEITPENSHVRFRKPPLDIRTTFDELEESLEPLIRETFEAKSSGPNDRSHVEPIQNIQKKLEQKNIGYDVEKLYNQSVG